MVSLIKYTVAVACLTIKALAHSQDEALKVGTNLKERPPAGVSWEKWHMKSEHGLDDYDADSVFQLHISKDKNALTREDILNMYGLLRSEVVGKGDGMGSHDDSEGITEATKQEIVNKVLNLCDYNRDGSITLDEWRQFSKNGGQLPDMGVGVGHHGDFEYEYEIHHWLEHHADEDPDVKVQHKEDIEHELLHHEHEIEHEDGTQDNGPGKKFVRTSPHELNAQIALNNIPTKYHI